MIVNGCYVFEKYRVPPQMPNSVCAISYYDIINNKVVTQRAVDPNTAGRYAEVPYSDEIFNQMFLLAKPEVNGTPAYWVYYTGQVLRFRLEDIERQVAQGVKLYNAVLVNAGESGTHIRFKEGIKDAYEAALDARKAKANQMKERQAEARRIEPSFLLIKHTSDKGSSGSLLVNSELRSFKTPERAQEGFRQYAIETSKNPNFIQSPHIAINKSYPEGIKELDGATFQNRHNPAEIISLSVVNHAVLKPSEDSYKRALVAHREIALDKSFEALIAEREYLKRKGEYLRYGVYVDIHIPQSPDKSVSALRFFINKNEAEQVYQMYKNAIPTGWHSTLATFAGNIVLTGDLHKFDECVVVPEGNIANAYAHIAFFGTDFSDITRPRVDPRAAARREANRSGIYSKRHY